MKYGVIFFLSILVIMAASSSFENKKKRFLLQNLVVIDLTTNLMWQKDTGIKDTNWNEAKKYCRTLNQEGFVDWRIPHIDELMSIVNKNAYNPSIDVNFFPNTTNDYYWTSIEHKGEKDRVWLVFFNYGYGHHYYKDANKGSVRCVRNIKNGDLGNKK